VHVQNQITSFLNFTTDYTDIHIIILTVIFQFSCAGQLTPKASKETFGDH